MKKVVCCPENLLPEDLDPNVLYFTMFSSTGREDIGHVAIDLPRAIRRDKLAPSVQAWDFTTIASAVAAADKAIPRDDTADGWTRMIELSICLVEPTTWDAERTKLEMLLRFLTGDFWKLHFLSDGVEPPRAKKPQIRSADCVCLLSGGIDSLVGAIDLTNVGRKPLLVSQVVRGDKEAQKRFAAELNGSERHCQWSYSVRHSGVSEKSTRARSIVFFAFATVAASGVAVTNGQPVDIIVPENGFISLNAPLGPGRLGSLSTKTTHPVYMSGIQELWNAVGIQARLIFPFQDKTKGELLLNCADPQKLVELIGYSTSCGKYQRHNLTHCGECIPCLVRRAAFLKANFHDTTTKGYLRMNLAQAESKDVAVAATAFLRYQTEGIRRFVGGALSFASHTERRRYEDVVARGMDELGALLSSHGVI